MAKAKQKDKNLIIVDHPLVQDSLGHVRDKYSSLVEFRCHSDKICYFLFAEALRGLEFKQVPITTPLEVTIDAPQLSEDVIIVPILRAGLAMMLGAIKMLPKLKVGLLGMERDEETAEAREYYNKIPEIREDSVVIVTDPMLATGGTVLHALDEISKYKCKEIRIVSVVTAPEGLAAIRKKYPKVKIFTAALDEKLNAVKYIVPGLGDYGDRYFGTSI